jgi:nickel-dependent lactate racemase
MLSAVDSSKLVAVGPTAVNPTDKTVLDLCRAALKSPVAADELAGLCASARKIVVIVSDATRDEPREEMLEALFEIVPRERATLVVASGTHVADADVVPQAFRGAETIVHRARAVDRCMDLGTTTEGTRVRILTEVACADLVVVTGRVHPHYFAGYSGGVKGVFPGCGYHDDILANHLLKADPTARLGRVADNRCRKDMEDAALRVRGRIFILDVLSDCEGTPVAAASGDPIAAHRALAEIARPLFVTRAPRSRIVVVADRPPVTRSLYQASKLLAPAGAILEAGGVIILVAECTEGIEPVERVNEGIYRLGIVPQLPPGHRVILVSALDAAIVGSCYAEYAPDLKDALSRAIERTGQEDGIPLLWRAGELIVEWVEDAA